MKRFLNIFAVTAALFLFSGCYEDIDLAANDTVTIIYYKTNDNKVAGFNGDYYDTWQCDIISNTYTNGVGKIVVKGEVKEFKPYFYNSDNLVSVTIPKGVTSIGNEAFMLCSKIESIEIPDGVIKIDNRAFAYCDGLTSVTIPNTVISIGEQAFTGCAGIKRLDIPNSVAAIGEWAFKNCENLESVEIPQSVKNIGKGAFYGCSLLESITVPNSVAIIDEWTFAWCPALRNATIGNNVKSLGEYAFYRCTELADIVIPNSVTTIGGYAFDGCTSLRSVTLGSSLVSIGGSAFWGCTNLKTVINHSNLSITKGSTTYGYVAYFANSVVKSSYTFSKINGENKLTGYTGNDTKLVLPADYNGESYSIAESAFINNKMMTSISIPQKVTSIGNYAFNGCSSLKEVYISDGENTLDLGYNSYNTDEGGKGLFYDCPLETVYMGRNIEYRTEKEYGYSPFDFKVTLKNMTFGNSVTKINRNILYSCINLENIRIPDNVRTIEPYSFYSSGVRNITIPRNVTTIGERCFGYCSNLETIVVEEGNSVYDSRGNCNAIIETSENRLIVGCKNTVIPNGITTLGYYAFEGNAFIENIEIPNTVTELENGVFSACTSLDNVVIPYGVTALYIYTFADCSSLKNVVIPGSVALIGSYAFGYCDNLEHITLPESVTNIYSYAFLRSDKLKTMYCKATTPPIIDSNALPANIESIYVPNASLAEYRSAWADYSSCIKGYDF